MKVYLEIEPSLYRGLRAHLLPGGNTREQAAFLFVQQSVRNGHVEFHVRDSHFAISKDFAAQHADYLELTDDARIRLIKTAYQLDASITELHSHPGPWPAAFSLADRAGLKETVPHMWWRLKNRPYVAVVVTNTEFDALVWLDNPRIPRRLDALLVGDAVLKPTNNSLRGWQ